MGREEGERDKGKAERGRSEIVVSYTRSGAVYHMVYLKGHNCQLFTDLL